MDIVEALRRLMEGGWTERSAAVEARFFDGNGALEYGGEPAGEYARGGDAILSGAPNLVKSTRGSRYRDGLGLINW